MSTAYAKIFESLFDGSLRGQSDPILVFVNILTHTRDGIADIHFKKISDETGIPVDRVKSACLVLEEPDPDSRTPDDQGRRIKRLDDHRDWGWRVVNHLKYRLLGGQDDRTKELTRIRVSKFKERRRLSETLGNVTETLPPVPVHGSVHDQGVRGVGEEDKIPWTWIVDWLRVARSNGADFSEEEAKVAWLSLKANGWMWGRNPVTDFRSAIECKIHDNRARKPANGKPKAEVFKEFGTAQQSEAMRKAELEEIAKLKQLRKSP